MERKPIRLKAVQGSLRRAGPSDLPILFNVTETERFLAAIGEPEMVDTLKDARPSCIFMNRTIRVYPSADEFYGMEETIERLVGILPPLDRAA